MKRYLLAFAFAACFAQHRAVAAPTFPPSIHLEVWSTQRLDDAFCSDEPVEFFFRVDESAYLTIYQINPWGGVEIIYPRPHHRWIAILPRRTYCLTDLAPDLYLDYEGIDGSAHLGVIATHDPIDLLPWLESGFRSRGFVFGRPAVGHSFIEVNVVLERIHADLRFRLGGYCEPAFFTRVIYLKPRPARPPVVIYRPPRPEVRIRGYWRNWRPSAPPAYEERRQDRRYRDARPSEERQRTIEKSPRSSSPPKPERAKDRRTRKP